MAQGWRTDTYRALASGASDKIHVLTVDYRGFGYSTGSPHENGLITDGVTLVTWALEVARIPPERIVIFGQSLGTAVAVAVAEHFALEKHVEFAGIVLVAGFSDIPSLMLSYYAGGILPILAPLRPYPWLQRFFSDYIQERWVTTQRLENLVRSSKNIDIQILHAKNDFNIPWSHSDTLFRTAANATVDGGMSLRQIDATKDFEDLGEGGWIHTWTAATPNSDGMKKIAQHVVVSGGESFLPQCVRSLTDKSIGHNRLPSFAIAAKAVVKAFKL